MEAEWRCEGVSFERCWRQMTLGLVSPERGRRLELLVYGALCRTGPHPSMWPGRHLLTVSACPGLSGPRTWRSGPVQAWGRRDDT